MQQSKPAELPKRRFKLPESKTTRIREASNSGKPFEVSEMVRGRDLISLNNAHTSFGYSKEGQENYDKIQWDKD